MPSMPQLPASHRLRATVLEALAWGLALVLCRGLLLVSDPLSVHFYDELHAGAVGQEWASGRGLPLTLMTWDPYSGGTLVVAALARLSFAAAGPSFLAFKAVAVVFSLATFLVWLALARRLYGQRAMRFFAVLFLLAPPMVAKLGLIAWGNHSESLLTTSAALLALTMLYGRGGVCLGGAWRELPRRWAYTLAFAAGCFSTLGLFVSYVALAGAVAHMLLVALLGRRALSRGLALSFAGGLGLGLVPMLLFALTRRLSGLLWFSGSVAPSPASWLAKARHFVWTDLRLFLAPHLSWPRPAEAAFWAVTLVAMASASWVVLRHIRARQGLPAEAILILNPAIFLIFFLVTWFRVAPDAAGVVAYRYLATLPPYLFAAVAVALSRVRGSAGVALLALLVTPNALYFLDRLPQANALRQGSTGASYFAYGRRTYDAADHDWSRTLGVLTRIPDAGLRETALRGATLTWTQDLGMPAWSRDPVRLAARTRDFLSNATSYKPAAQSAVAWLGYLLVRPTTVALSPEDGAAFLAVLADRTEVDIAPLARSAILGRAENGTGGAELVAVAESLEGARRTGAYQGLGAVAARRLCRQATDPPTPPAATDDRAAYFRGLGLELTLDRAGPNCPRLPLLPRPKTRADRSALDHGVRDGLELCEPDDDALRPQLAWQLGLAPFLDASAELR